MTKKQQNSKSKDILKVANSIRNSKKKFPFIQCPSHIYNTLADNNIGKLNCFGETYTFELHGNLKLDGVNCNGITEFDSKTIKLDVSLTDSEAKETIIHEMIHVVLENLGLHEANFDGKLIQTTNEFLAQTIGKQIHLLAQANLQLFNLLHREVDDQI